MIKRFFYGLLIILVLGANSISISTSISGASAAETAKPAENLQDLLARVQSGYASDAAADAAREAQFVSERAKQKAAVQRANTAIIRAEAQSVRLEKKFSENEARLAALQSLLDERLGVLGALFGQVRLVAAQSAGQIEASLISGELVGRAGALRALAQSTDVPDISQLENLWAVLHQEMTAQGTVGFFHQTLAAPDGTIAKARLLRVGGFTAFNADGLVRYVPVSASTPTDIKEHFAVPARQPSRRIVNVAEDLFASLDDAPDDASIISPLIAVIDPSRGALLDALVQVPTMRERLAQGGIIGSLIIGLGFIGLVLGAVRLRYLASTARLIAAQLRGIDRDKASPLMRVLQAVKNTPETEHDDTLDIKLEEAVLKELPPLEKHLGLIKVLAAVAPLLGLLGTVTGMILTFEAIARFGTGDPKLMADGISQALVTTALGLVVAIPLLGIHALAITRARTIADILEEQATALLAAQEVVPIKTEQ